MEMRRWQGVSKWIIIGGVLVSTSINGLFPQPVNAAVPQVLLNNVVLSTNVPAVNIQSNLQVPAKELASALGGSFSFNTGTNEATLKLQDSEIVFLLNSRTITVNGKIVTAPAPMVLVNNRLMIPARFLCDTIGIINFIEGDNLRVYQSVNGKITYKVVSGDYLWRIAQKFGTSISAIKALNNLTTDNLFVGQLLTIEPKLPAGIQVNGVTTSNATVRSGADFNAKTLGYVPKGALLPVIGKQGDWYKVRSSFGIGYIYKSIFQVTQDTSPAPKPADIFAAKMPVDTSKNSLTYITYTVVKGDTLWSVAEKHGILFNELAGANGLSSSSYLSPGQQIKIPVHHVAVKPTPESRFGEVLDWFSEGQYVFSIGKTGKFTDLSSGRSFMAQRTMGASHSDTETLTLNDTQVMKDIFGGNWTWSRRAFLLEVDGRKIAVSVSGMPHAGVDNAPFLANVDNRTGNYGSGPNYDKIKGNGMDGHFDVYTLNGIGHSTGKIERGHQVNVMLSGGME